MPIDSPVSGQRFGLLDLAGKGDEPLAGPAEHAGRLDHPFELAVPANGDPADAGELQATALPSILLWARLEAVAVFLEAEPGEAVPPLEARITGVLAGLDPAKERLECLVQIGHDVLEDVAVDVQRIRASGFLDLDLAKLHGLGDRHAVKFVGVLPLAQESVVEVAAGRAHGFQPAALALAGIQAVDECLEHSRPLLRVASMPTINGFLNPRVARRPFGCPRAEALPEKPA